MVHTSQHMSQKLHFHMSLQERAPWAPMQVNGETGIREQQVKGKVRITLALTHSTVRIEQHSRVQTQNSAWDQA